MKTNLNQQKRQILSEIRSLAAERYEKKGFLDLDDVEELKNRAADVGGVGRDQAADLNFVRDYYKDVLTHDAAHNLSGFLDTWVSNAIRQQMARDRDKAREKKVEKQLDEREMHFENIDEHHEDVHVEDKVEDSFDDVQSFDDRREDLLQRMGSMDVDDKNRVLLSHFFGHRGED